MTAPRKPFGLITATALYAALILLVYGQVITGGADLFIYDDPETLFRWGHNASTDGWRFDVFLGQTFLFGDPGAMHPWSPLALLGPFFSDRKLAFHATVLLLLTAACVAQYALLRRLIPAGIWIALLVAPLTVFNTYLSKCLLQRHWISQAIAMPLCLLIIRGHLDRPRPLHVAQLALVFFVALFFGSAAAWSGVVVVAAMHVAIEAWCRRAETGLVRVLFRGGLLIGAANAVMALLGAWIFWSIFVAGSAESVLRDPRLLPFGGEVPATAVGHAWVPLSRYYEFISYMLHVGWQPWSNDLIGGTFLQSQVVMLASVAVPALLVFLLGSGRLSSVERSILALVLLLFGIRVLPLVPYFDVAMAVVRLRDVLHPVETPVAFASVQVTCLALALDRLRRGDWPARLGTLRRVLAAVPLVFYGGLTIAGPMLTQEAIVSWVARALAGAAAKIAGVDRHLAEAILAFNFAKVGESVGLFMFAFYLLSALVAASLVFPRIVRAGDGRRASVLALALLVDGLLLAATIHPPNRQPLVWDDTARDGRPLHAMFEPWDRFYRVEIAPEQQTRDLAYFERFWFRGEFGPFVRRSGYELVPGGNLSATKPFTPYAAAALIDAAFRDGGHPVAKLRDLIRGPLVVSRVLDVASVRYYYSERPLPAVDGLELIHKSRQLYVYQRPDAFPFVYLASNVRSLLDVKDLATAAAGDAFVNGGDKSRVPATGDGGAAAIAGYGRGRVEIKTTSVSPRLLVVSDGWHPFWKAAVDGEPAEILRVNVAFKGVVVPAGDHSVSFHFDATPASGGLVISVTAWLLLIVWFAIEGWRRRDVPLARAA